MMYTEEEAREKWCPFARVSEGDLGGSHGHPWAAAVNRTWLWIRKRLGWEPGQPETEICNCIASQCMAWRWFDKVETGQPPPDPCWRGYCGLAGVPS